MIKPISIISNNYLTFIGRSDSIIKYDRNHELYRLKKWIRDFNKNGFNLTGGVATFKPSYYEGKQPIDLINDVGEHLKENKLIGENYYIEFD